MNPNPIGLATSGVSFGSKLSARTGAGVGHAQSVQLKMFSRAPHKPSKLQFGSGVGVAVGLPVGEGVGDPVGVAVGVGLGVQSGEQAGPVTLFVPHAASKTSTMVPIQFFMAFSFA